MSRWGVVVTRRFVSNAHGEARLVELHRSYELGIPPVPGMVLIFPDGTEVTVSTVRHRLDAGGYGIRPVEVELRCTRESLAGLEQAEATGWLHAEDVAPRVTAQ